MLYPFLRPAAMFHGAVEVRGSHEKFGLAADEVRGTWQALCDRARSFPGATVSATRCSRARPPPEIAAALAPLAGLEVHVVVTARDPGRQATAHWQEEVKLGDVGSFAELERTQFRADTHPGDPARPHFWHAQDSADALRRWSTAVPPDGSTSSLPASGAPARAVERFAGAVGLGPGPGRPRLGRRRRTSRSAPSRSPTSGGQRAAGGPARRRDLQPSREEGVRRGGARGQPGERPRTPAGSATSWSPPPDLDADIAAAGHPVHGTSTTCSRSRVEPGTPTPTTSTRRRWPRSTPPAWPACCLAEAAAEAAGAPQPAGGARPSGAQASGRLRRAAARLRRAAPDPGRGGPRGGCRRVDSAHEDARTAGCARPARGARHGLRERQHDDGPGPEPHDGERQRLAPDGAGTSASAHSDPGRPACAAVWKDGRTLPRGYHGCVRAHDTWVDRRRSRLLDSGQPLVTLRRPLLRRARTGRSSRRSSPRQGRATTGHRAQCRG